MCVKMPYSVTTLASLFIVLTTCNGFEINMTAQYNSVEEVVVVHFDSSKYNYSNYSVEIVRSEFPDDCNSRSDSPFREAVVHENSLSQVKLPGPYLSGHYCISVTLLESVVDVPCKENCQRAYKRIYIKTKENTSCCRWTADVDIDPPKPNHYGTYQMRVSVNILAPFQSCFSYLNISLWYGAYKLCDGVSGHKVDSTTVSVARISEGAAVFDNLPPGNYCLRLKVLTSICDNFWSTRYNEVINLANLTAETWHVTEPESGSITDIPIIVVFVVVIVSALLGITTLICRKYKTKISSLKTVLPSSNEMSLDDLLQLAEEKARKLEVVLLYSRDFEEHVEVVRALYRFLLYAFGFRTIVFDQEEEAVIFLNPDSWVQKVAAPHPTRRFLIVESEGAVLQEEGKKKIKIVRPKDEDRLDDIFPYALELLKERTRGLCDYENIFVVKFKYTAPDLILKCIVPNIRYTLPKHIMDLYFAILDLPSPSLAVRSKLEDELRRKWDGPLQQELLQRISAVSEMLRKNPDLVKEFFSEQELGTRSQNIISEQDFLTFV